MFQKIKKQVCLIFGIKTQNLHPITLTNRSRVLRKCSKVSWQEVNFFKVRIGPLNNKMSLKLIYLKSFLFLTEISNSEKCNVLCDHRYSQDSWNYDQKRKSHFKKWSDNEWEVNKLPLSIAFYTTIRYQNRKLWLNLTRKKSDKICLFN